MQTQATADQDRIGHAVMTEQAVPQLIEALETEQHAALTSCTAPLWQPSNHECRCYQSLNKAGYGSLLALLPWNHLMHSQHRCAMQWKRQQ
jgi:hypothetical protein